MWPPTKLPWAAVGVLAGILETMRGAVRNRPRSSHPRARGMRASIVLCSRKAIVLVGAPIVPLRTQSSARVTDTRLWVMVEQHPFRQFGWVDDERAKVCRLLVEGLLALAEPAAISITSTVRYGGAALASLTQRAACGERCMPGFAAAFVQRPRPLGPESAPTPTCTHGHPAVPVELPGWKRHFARAMPIVRPFLCQRKCWLHAFHEVCDVEHIRARGGCRRRIGGRGGRVLLGLRRLVRDDSARQPHECPRGRKCAATPSKAECDVGQAPPHRTRHGFAADEISRLKKARFRCMSQPAQARIPSPMAGHRRLEQHVQPRSLYRCLPPPLTTIPCHNSQC